MEKEWWKEVDINNDVDCIGEITVVVYSIFLIISIPEIPMNAYRLPQVQQITCSRFEEAFSLQGSSWVIPRGCEAHCLFAAMFPIECNNIPYLHDCKFDRKHAHQGVKAVNDTAPQRSETWEETPPP